MEKDLKKLAEIRSEMEALEEKETALKAKILVSMKEDGETKIERDFGVFNYVSKVSTWEYSEALKEKKKKIKKLEVDEQEKGIAKPKMIEYVQFVPAK